MASFVSGLIQGGADEGTSLEESGKSGLRSKLKKKSNPAPKLKSNFSGGASNPENYPSFKRGGKVKKTGLARLHRGERVLTRRQAKRYRGKRGASKGR